MDNFSSRLNRRMAERGVTQKELAASASLAQGAVSKYMNGRQEPKPRELHALSKALAVPMEFWFDEAQPENANPQNEILLWKSRAVQAEKEVKELRTALEKISIITKKLPLKS